MFKICRLIVLVTLATSIQASQNLKLRDLVKDRLRRQADEPKCLLRGDKEMYDLEEIEGDMWLVGETKWPDRAYISICSKLHPDYMPNECTDTSASVCVVNTTSGTVSNGGRFKQGPKMEEGQLVLTYIDGDDCMDRGEPTKYSTKIYFQCVDRYDIAQEPEYKGMVGNCEFQLLWPTVLACPIDIEEEETDMNNNEKCETKFPGTDYDVSLLGLRKKDYYHVQGEGQVFQVNICDNVRDGACATGVAVCEVDGQQLTQKRPLGTGVSGKIIWDGDDLKVEYKGDGITTIINLVCDRDPKDTDLKFVSESNGKITFTLSTHLACPPKIHDCEIQNYDGDKVNLGTLGKWDGNWQVWDSRDNHKDLTYFINVCQPINDAAEIGNGCNGGPMSACGTSTSTHETWNLGYMYQPPKLNADGSISLIYEGGTPCHGDQFARSTIINFICSNEKNDPEFVAETPECQYIINWETPEACFEKKIIGSDCKVKDDLYGHQYDLNELHKTLGAYEVTTQKGKYEINFCGDINKPCNGRYDVGACLTHDGKEVVAGLASSTITYDEGTLTMDMLDGDSDDKCDYRSVQVIFLCNRNDDASVHVVSENCYTFLTVPSKHSCPPITKIECSTQDDDGNVYDLSPLTLEHFNYWVNSERDSNVEYLINVCRSIVHTRESRCPYKSGVCRYDKDKDDAVARFTNFGDIENGPVFEGGKLKVKYSNGAICMGSSAAAMSAIIVFECGDAEGMPELVNEGACQVEFTWRTLYACKDEHQETLTGDCTATDPATGFKYDFSSLKKEDGYVTNDPQGNKYTLNVCDAVENTACGKKDVGVCMEVGDKTVNIGRPNSEIHLHGETTMYLNYSNGESCQDGKYKTNTIILFICHPEGDDYEGPMYVQETFDCTYMFNWYTELACQVKVPCLVETENGVIDLTALRGEEANYVMIANEHRFFLTLCRPLAPVEGLDCDPSAAACYAKAGGDDGFYNELSLGRPLVSPQLMSDGSIELMYVHGSKCPLNEDLEISTRIVFKCQRGIKSLPNYVTRTDDCQYVFDWSTELVCKDEDHGVQEIGDDCMYNDIETGVSFDLSLLRKEYSSYWINKGSKAYTLNICKKAQSCGEGVGVCKQEGADVVDYGRLKGSTFAYDGEKLSYVYGDGQSCDKNFRENFESQIWFTCDKGAGYGEPKLYAEYDCAVVFLWKTSLVCSDDTGTIVQDEDVKYATSSSNTGTIVAVIFCIALVTLIVAVLWKKERREVLYNTVNSAIHKARYSALYTRLDAGREESSVLLGADGTTTSYRRVHEDDELLRI